MIKIRTHIRVNNLKVNNPANYSALHEFHVDLDLRHSSVLVSGKLISHYSFMYSDIVEGNTKKAFLEEFMALNNYKNPQVAEMHLRDFPICLVEENYGDIEIKKYRI